MHKIPKSSSKERIKQNNSANSTDFTNSYQISNNILKSISQPNGKIQGKKKHRYSKSQGKFNQQSFQKHSNSGYFWDEGTIQGLSDTTMNVLNTTLNQTVVIEENFPRVLGEIERSVIVLKKFYSDLCSKQKLKPYHNHSNSNINNTSEQTTAIINQDIKYFSRPNIETIQKEYERVHRHRTNDIQVLYEFYVNEYLNRSLKSTTITNGLYMTNLNNSSTAHLQSSPNEGHLLQTPFTLDISNPHDVPNTPSNTNRNDQEAFQEIEDYRKLDKKSPSPIKSVGSSKSSQSHSVSPNENIAKFNSNQSENQNREQKELGNNASSNFSKISEPETAGYQKELNENKIDINIHNIESPPFDKINPFLGSKSPNISPQTKFPRSPLMNSFGENNSHFTFAKGPVKINDEPITLGKPLITVQKCIKQPANSIQNSKYDREQRLIKNSIQIPVVSQTKSKDHMSQEIFNKIYEKNMLINKLKQEINQNLQEISNEKKCSSKLLNFDDLLNKAQSGKDPMQSNEWIDQHCNQANLDEAIISSQDQEEDIDQEDDKQLINFALELENAMKEDSNKGSIVHNEENTKLSIQEKGDQLKTLLEKQLPLNNYDLKLIEELKNIVTFINQEPLSNLKPENSGSNMFQIVRKNVELGEKFKKTKFYVPEIPQRKLRILDVKNANEEEEKLHEKELQNFFKNNNIIKDLENFLDNSNAMIPDPKKNELKHKEENENIEDMNFLEELNQYEQDQNEIKFEIEFENQQAQNSKNTGQEQEETEPSILCSIIKDSTKKTQDKKICTSEKKARTLSEDMKSILPSRSNSIKETSKDLTATKLIKLQNLDVKLRKILVILEREFKLAKKNEQNEIKEKIKKYKAKKVQVENKIMKMTVLK